MPMPDSATLKLLILNYSNEGTIIPEKAIERVSDDANLSQEEREAMIPSKRRTKVGSKTHGAITSLFQASLLQRIGYARYAITDKGKEELATNRGLLEKFLNKK